MKNEIMKTALTGWLQHREDRKAAAAEKPLPPPDYAADIYIDPDWSAAVLQQAKAAIQDRIDIVDEDVHRIKDQLAMAGAKAHAERVFADPYWYRSAQSALRHKTKQRQTLALRLGEANRALKQAMIKEKDSKFSEAFIQAAKVLLPHETFCRICDEARKKAQPQ